MIYTVTFNPAIDYVVYLDELNTGKINRVTNEHIMFGGKGINVSVVLNTLGINSVALGFVAGFTGVAIEQGIAEKGIKADFIKVEKGNSRINVKIKSDSETEINGNGPNITEEDLCKLYQKLDKLQQDDYLVLAGSIPTSVPNDIYEKIMLRLSNKGVKCVVDATKDLLKNVLKYKPFLIKPNNIELGEFFGVEIRDKIQAVNYAKKLQDYGAENVLVSMAGDGAVLVTKKGQALEIGVAKGNVLNSVGAGDSMLAGFLAGYIETGNYSYALKLGTACGGATAFSVGLAEREDIYNLLEQLWQNENQV